MTSSSAGPPAEPDPPGLSWSWAKAGLGLAYAAPAAVLTAIDPDRGLLLAIGVMCAAAACRRCGRSERCSRSSAPSPA